MFPSPGLCAILTVWVMDALEAERLSGRCCAWHFGWAVARIGRCIGRKLSCTGLDIFVLALEWRRNAIREEKIHNTFQWKLLMT